MLAIRDERDSSSASSFFTRLIRKAWGAGSLYTHTRGGRPMTMDFKEALALMGIKGGEWNHLTEQEKHLYKKAWAKAQSIWPTFNYGKDLPQKTGGNQSDNEASEP